MSKQKRLYHYVLDDLLDRTSLKESENNVIIPIFLGKFFESTHDEFMDDVFNNSHINNMLGQIRERITYNFTSSISFRFFLQTNPRMSKEFFDHLYHHGLREESNEVWDDYIKSVRKKISKKSFYWWIVVRETKIRCKTGRIFKPPIKMIVKFVKIVVLKKK